MSDPTPSRFSLLPLLSVVFVGTLGYSIVLPFLIFLVIGFGGNAFVYGIIGATYSLFQLFGAPLLGRWSDRYGRRPVLLLTQAGTLAAWLLFLVALYLPVMTLTEVNGGPLGAFSLTLPLVVLFAARALDGLTGGNISVADAYLADVTTEEERGASFGKMAVAQNLGYIAGPALAGLLGATVLKESLPVGAAILISVVALWIIATQLPETSRCRWTEKTQSKSIRKAFGQEMRHCHEPQGGERLTLWRVLRMKGIAPLLTIHFFVFLAFNFFYVAFPTYAASDLGWSVTGVGLFFSYLSALMVLVQGPVLKRMSGRWTDQTLVRVGGLILAVSFVFFAADAVWMLLVGAALLSVGNGLMWPSLLARLSKTTDPSHQGSVQGIAASSGAVASIGGLVLGGFLYEGMGVLVFVLAAVVVLVSWGVSMVVRGEQA